MSSSQHAVIVSLDLNTDEIVQLAETMEYSIQKIFTQNLNAPTGKYFIGTGKTKEIQAYIQDSQQDINLVIINGTLKPSQWFNLEQSLNTQVYDRVHLILSIFEQRAQRKEARLQVKLAQLQYERPYVRELIHRARAGEHPGLMAGGEYQVDDYYEMIKKQTKTIKQELEKVRKDRKLHRKTRYQSGFYLISLAGYTNAGKSSLLNLLAQDNVTVEGKLFSTLSTTTRRIPKKYLANTMPILLTDTVGFIESLPPWIIDAFHSTLEEIEVADMVLLVVDASEPLPRIQDKLRVSQAELTELGVIAPVILVFNKIDLLSLEEVNTLLHTLRTDEHLKDKPYVSISVHEEKNIDTLLDIIYTHLPQKIHLQFFLPNTSRSHSFLSRLYYHTQIKSVSYDEKIHVDLFCNTNLKEKLEAEIIQLHGILLE